MDSIHIHEKNKNNVLMIVKLNVKKRQQIIPQKERENRGEIESGNSIVERKYIFLTLSVSINKLWCVLIVSDKTSLT